MTEHGHDSATVDGQATVERMFGKDVFGQLADRASKSEFGSAMFQLALDQIFSEIWARPGLTPRERSIVVLSVLLANGKADQFRQHVGGGINNGLTAREIEEICVQAYPYAGYPAAITALLIAEDVLKNRNLI